MNNIRSGLTILFILSFAFKTIAGDNPNDYKRTPHGLRYKIHKKGPGTKPIMEGYYVNCHWWLRTMNDSLITSSDAFGATPEFEVKKPTGNSDVFEGFFYLSKGDSATFLINVDSAYKGGPPPFAKAGDWLKYTVVVMEVYTPREYALMKKLALRKQKEVDENLIKAYLQQNKLKANRTDSGLYYIVEEPGNVVKPHSGQAVTVNYTGMLLDGTKFDSNTLPEFRHTQPFTFTLGTGGVIKGWELGIPLFGVGGKGKLIIPSRFAYGSYGSGDVIKPDAVLVFDIEVIEFK